MKSTFGVVAAVGAAIAVAACSSDNTGFNPKTAKGPDQSCVLGELTVGSTMTGDLSKTASSCSYPAFYDSAEKGIAVSYNFGAQAGHGYLLSLLTTFKNQISLVGTNAGVAATEGYAWYDSPSYATIPLIAQSNAAFSVRVGAYDSVAADTGAYTLRAQSCKVPVATIIDSTTHADNVGPGDCTVPLSDYYGYDSAYVHLYAIQFDSGATRTITLTASDSSLAYDLGGPEHDPYGYFDGNYGGAATGNYNVKNSTFNFTATTAGIYTLMVGTSHYTPTAEPYTLTVGGSQPAASRVPSHTLSVGASDKTLRRRR